MITYSRSPASDEPVPAAHEIPLLEQVEVGLASEELRHRARPERPADDGRGLEGRLLERREPVEPGGDDRLHAVRNGEALRDIADRPAVADPLDHACVHELADELLDEERVPLGALDEKLPQPGRKLEIEQALDETRCVPLLERIEPDRRCVAPAAAPRLTAGEELRTRGREHRDGGSRLALDPLEQVEKVVLRPVDVLEQHDGGPLSRNLLHEADRRGMQPLARVERMKPGRRVPAQRKPQDLLSLELLDDGAGRGSFEKPEVLLQHLAERPVRDPVAVRQTASRAAHRHRVLDREPLPELLHERRLPDTGLADDRHEMRLALTERAANGGEQQVDLALPPDEHLPEAGKAARTGERERTHDGMGDDATRLALRLEHARFPELEGASRRRDRPLAGEHLAGSRALLETRADVHGIARDERPSLGGPYDDLAGVDADAHCKLSLEELPETPLHGEARVQRALGMILERSRGTEDGHDPVPGELLDRSARALDLGGHRLVEAREARPHALGILVVRESRRADEVGEEHRRELSLLPCRLHLRSAAGWAKPCIVGDGRTAAPATSHARECSGSRRGGRGGATGEPLPAPLPRLRAPRRARRPRSPAGTGRGCSSRARPPSAG